MDITLYSTGCANCKMLEAKLKAKKIEYRIESNMSVMEEKGLMSVPALDNTGVFCYNCKKEHEGGRI